MNKKGLFTLSQATPMILTVVLIAAIGVGGFLVLDGMTDNVDYTQDPRYSASAANGCNSTDTFGCYISTAAANASLGLEDFYGYFPTILTIAAVSILLGLIVVGFAFGRSKGFF